MALALVRQLRVAGATMLVLIGTAASALPQTAPANPWNRGTTLELFAGAANAAPNTTETFGAAVGWEINHLAELEGDAAWLAERRGAQAFAADLTLLLNLTRPARVVPYLGGGAGMYWASFDAARATPPPFYLQRMTRLAPTPRATFRDPTAVIAGGANIFVAIHFSVRPEVNLRLVTDGSNVYKVTTLSFALIYHIEEHPSRRVH